MGCVRASILVAMAAAVAVCGLAWAQEDTSAGLPVAEATPLWTYITEESPYADWQLLLEGASSGPALEEHGALGRTFVNAPAGQAIEARQSELPAGSIIVRESWDETGDKVRTLAVMYKTAGYNPAAGDWYWLLTSPEAASADRFLAQGKVDSCLACHVGDGDNDYVMGIRLGR